MSEEFKLSTTLEIVNPEFIMHTVTYGCSIYAKMRIFRKNEINVTCSTGFYAFQLAIIMAI